MTEAIVSESLPTPPRLRLCRHLVPVLTLGLLVNPLSLGVLDIHIPYQISFLWSPLLALAVGLALACGTEIAAAILRPVVGLMRGDTEPVLDEGGLRILRPRPRACAYVPYESIGACALFENGVPLRAARRGPDDRSGPHATAFRGAVLVAHDLHGSLLFELALRSSRARDAAERLHDVLASRPLDAVGPSHLRSLGRQGRSLAAWARCLRELGCSSEAGPYRSVVPSQRALADSVADPTLPMDVRVGALFAASAPGSSLELGAVGRNAPPLLLAAMDAAFPSRRTARLVADVRVRAQVTAEDWCDLRALRVASRKSTYRRAIP